MLSLLRAFKELEASRDVSKIAALNNRIKEATKTLPHSKNTVLPILNSKNIAFEIFSFIELP